MGFGISFLIWMDSSAKEVRQKHIESEKNIEDEKNKKKFKEDFILEVKEDNEKLQEEMYEFNNQILDSYELVNKQLRLLNKEIQAIKGKIETKQKE
jgi:hypothetical protein